MLATITRPSQWDPPDLDGDDSRASDLRAGSTVQSRSGQAQANARVAHERQRRSAENVALQLRSRQTHVADGHVVLVARIAHTVHGPLRRLAWTTHSPHERAVAASRSVGQLQAPNSTRNASADDAPLRRSEIRLPLPSLCRRRSSLTQVRSERTARHVIGQDHGSLRVRVGGSEQNARCAR